jgi:hypothetical protein
MRLQIISSLFCNFANQYNDFIYFLQKNKKQVILDMEDLGNYFYWILLVIAGISSLLGKFGKAKNRQNKPKDNQPWDWEDMLGELSGEKKPQSKPVETENRRAITSKTEMQKTVYQPKPLDSRIAAGREGIRTIKPVETVMTDIQEDITGSFSQEDIPDNAEEWRKVVVYNEIFNRKY